MPSLFDLMFADHNTCPFANVGCNGDWSVGAIHASPGKPNVTSGDLYVLDGAEYPDSLGPIFALGHIFAVRTFNEDGDEDKVIFLGASDDMEAVAALIPLLRAESDPARREQMVRACPGFVAEAA